MKLVVNDESIRIDKYLCQYLEESRTTIHKMIDDEFITVDGKKVKSNFIVKPGMEIDVKEGYIKPLDIKAEDIPLDIVYEDDYLMIINKPSGMVVHPGNGNEEGTLVNALMNYTNKLSSINGEMRPGIVHRIDKDTSGLLVVAKNDKTHELLSDMLSRHEINRTYYALLKGEFKGETAVIDAPIGRNKQDRKKMAVTPENSKNAITHLRVLKKYYGYTLAELKLETGRTHQIRVHMQYIGFPIYNDPVYTNDKCTEFGQFLHSKEIDFIHPITKERIHYECELPEEFKNFINTLEEK